MSAVAEYLNLGLCTLLPLLLASNLAAQTPGSYPTSASTDLPRFTLREIVTGSNDTLSRIPGPWLRAAVAARPESLAVAGYHKWARLSGVAPIEGKALASERFHHVMGLYRREQLTHAGRRTLRAIRSTIPGDTTRARFDHLFRPRGEWIVVVPVRKILIPEVTLTVEDGFPDVIASRILIPLSGKGDE